MSAAAKRLAMEDHVLVRAHLLQALEKTLPVE
jgi:hypothetical protein